jgi:indolepyruvate ferredoxin oxidoreductase alpha subunit
MNKHFLLGDEAIAQAGIDAGMSGIYAYPGTPSTEITEYVQRSREAREKNIKSTWSVNEKTAMESALGMSYAGKRAMVCMKHVGLNVAADPFINSAITGANGGLLVVSADDPSMHSSQNEQDSRFFGKFAMIPVLEPSNQQEAYDMVHDGFDISEKYGTPVLLRITTRLAHSRAGIILSNFRKQNEIKLPENLKQYILLPALARKRYKILLSNQQNFEKESEEKGWNKYFEANDKTKGIIVCGIAFNYLRENFQSENIPHPVLKIGQYPFPKMMIEKICDECEEIFIFEEGYPFLEESLRGILNRNFVVHGRLDGFVPRDGELNPNILAKALGLPNTFGKNIPEIVQNRPPSLCKGCPHIDAFLDLNEALSSFSKGRVFSDIGCYTLGALPPFESINSCVDMGASITMAKGAADAGLVPVIAVIGDSTFAHSGITGLIDAVHDRTSITILIVDNETTGMTGGQSVNVTGRIEEICKGVGVESEHIHILSPLKKFHTVNTQILRDEIAYEGVSVIITRRECIQTSGKYSGRKTEDMLV